MLTSTQIKIHESAMKHFLKDGFQKASLRKIVSDAGFTLGAFYGYYDSKEALFNALVEDTAKDIIAIISGMGDNAERLLPGRQTEGMSEVFSEKLPELADYLLAHQNELRLLLKCSEGTGYEHFLSDLKDRDLDFIQALSGGRMPVSPLTAGLLVNSYFSLLGDAALSGGSRETVIRTMQEIHDVFAGGITYLIKGKAMQ